MRIANWNINSLRLRIEQVKKIAKEHDIDIICLQETKVQDSLFPSDFLKEMGYQYLAFSGEKSYNGVAIISRIPIYNIQTINFTENCGCRHISIQLANKIEIHNLYIPAGGDEPDIIINPKFAMKLEFIRNITQWFKDNRNPDHPIIALGDFNIAPLEHDVWSHKQLLKVVSHTPIEIDLLKSMQNSLDWTDVSRYFVSDDQKLYSWWSYRNKSSFISDRGRRLDHIWITPKLKSSLKHSFILKETRQWESPSDHVPIIADIAID